MAGLVPAIRVFFDGRFAGSISCLQRNAWKKDVGGQSKSGRDDHLDSSRAITCSRDEVPPQCPRDEVSLLVFLIRGRNAASAKKYGEDPTATYKLCAAVVTPTVV